MTRCPVSFKQWPTAPKPTFSYSLMSGEAIHGVRRCVGPLLAERGSNSSPRRHVVCSIVGVMGIQEKPEGYERRLGIL